MHVRLLVSADLHLGRRSSKVTDVAIAERCSTTAIWQAMVAEAIASQVDAVLLAGDVVDAENRFFEATGPLERGIRELTAAGIEVFAVAGNHDWDVLPQLADALACPGFHLLGREGRWEEARLERDGRTLLRVQGWSFPTARHRASPLRDYALSASGEAPLVGLLHCDIDALESPHAPVSVAELNARDGFALWALGHIHAPRSEPLATGGHLLYPGSPQAMDPGEPGQHGPWLIELGGPEGLVCQQLPLSRVRYETVPVDLEGTETLETARSRIFGQFSQHVLRLAEQSPQAEWLSLRLRLEGRTRLCGRLEQLAATAIDDLEKDLPGGGAARVDAIVDATRPAYDLAELAKRNDPPGMLASLLLQLETNDGPPDPQLQRLLSEVHNGMLHAHRAAAYQPLAHDPPPTLAAARGELSSQGLRLLSALLEQVAREEEPVA